MNIKMIAQGPRRIRGQMIDDGASFEVTRKEARILNALGHARAEDAEVQKTLGKAGKPPSTRGGAYARRDMRAAPAAGESAPLNEAMKVSEDNVESTTITEKPAARRTRTRATTAKKSR